MSKLFIEDSTLTAIGDAIREKTGKTDLIAPGSMPAEIKAIVSGGGGEGDCNGLHVPEEALVISGIARSMFIYGSWDWFLEKFGNRITTENLTYASNMFNEVSVEEIPFALNFDITEKSVDVNAIFQRAKNLKAIPEIHNLNVGSISNMFDGCFALEEFPKQFGADWDWTNYKTLSAYSGTANNMFAYCYRLRSIPSVYNTQNLDRPTINASGSFYYYVFNCCYSLEKAVLPVYTQVTWTSNAFSPYSFENCCRLKELVFEVQADGTPYTANWKNQVIDLSKYCGWNNGSSRLPSIGFTNDTLITTSAQRYAYCNGAIYDNEEPFEKDGWADVVGWSTFGRSAVKKLFATLPDTSAAGGGNTIKFKEQAAIKCGTSANSDAIATLTEEEIAVATAKGWTVSLV